MWLLIPNMDSPSNEESLDEFLTQWQEEIEAGESAPRAGKFEAVNIARPVPAEDGSDIDSPAKRQALSVSGKESPLLLVLPAGRVRPDQVKPSEAVLSKVKESKDKDCLVDVLIADLNEINTVPFFDVQLPREIAVVIFQFLDLRDLCHCAMVSKSWNVLAEDNLLWYGIYRRVASKPILNLDVSVQWKSVVQDLVLQKRQVERNWKERICGLSDHQPDDCRVLCCVSYFDGTILSCYSSGTLYVWNLSSDDGPTRLQQIPGPHLISEPTCCDLLSPWGVVGTSDGCLKILDTETCSQVYCLSDLGAVDSVSISCTEGHLAVGVASHHVSMTAVRSGLSILVADGDNSWKRTQLSLNDVNSQLTRVKLLSSHRHPCSVLYSTSTSLTLHPLHSTPTHILSALQERGGATCISCFEADTEMTTLACGTSAFGYQVQLFDLPSGASRSSLKGHGLQVTSLHMPPTSSSVAQMLVSGSADKRVRVFDCRSQNSFPIMTLRGHSAAVRCVQMDQWKVISGSSDGMLVVWDQRMAGELWRTHERHPVAHCSLDRCYLVCAHVPLNKHPIRSVSENPNVCHRRLRGLVRVMDFSVDPLYYTKNLPSIFSSQYDEPSASFFNLDLKLPYDTIT